MDIIGRTIANRYEIISKTGVGGMATVYVARDKVLNRDVAVKVLKDEFTTDDEFVKRLVFHFSNINALHPFREGNGRSQREFIRELALYNDYVINFSLASEEEMLNASIDSFLCKYEKMEVLFKKCLRPIK